MGTDHEPSDAILPAGVNLLDEVFTEILTERRLPRGCEAAERIAIRLLAIYQSGVHERDVLRQMAAED